MAAETVFGKIRTSSVCDLTSALRLLRSAKNGGFDKPLVYCRQKEDIVLFSGSAFHSFESKGVYI